MTYQRNIGSVPRVFVDEPMREAGEDGVEAGDVDPDDEADDEDHGARLEQLLPGRPLDALQFGPALAYELAEPAALGLVAGLALGRGALALLAGRARRRALSALSAHAGRF